MATEVDDRQRQLEMERSRAEVAEKAHASLQAEMDLIRKQLDLEQENISKCKKFLDPEDLVQLETEQNMRNADNKTTGTSDRALSTSEQILMKYKRSNELRQFFERKY